MLTLANTLFNQQQSVGQKNTPQQSNAYGLIPCSDKQCREIVNQPEHSSHVQIVSHQGLTLFVAHSRVVAAIKPAGLDHNGNVYSSQYFVAHSASALAPFIQLKVLRQRLFQSVYRAFNRSVKNHKTESLSCHKHNTIKWHTVRLVA
jgi:hypothetical protein